MINALDKKKVKDYCTQFSFAPTIIFVFQLFRSYFYGFFLDCRSLPL